MRRRALPWLLFLFGSVAFSCSDSDEAKPGSGGDAGASVAGQSSDAGAGGVTANAGSSGQVTGEGGEGGAEVLDLPPEILAYCDAAADYICRWDAQCHGAEECTFDHGELIRKFCREKLPAIWAADLYEFDAELAATCMPDPPYCADRPVDFLDSGPCLGVFKGKRQPGEACGSLSSKVKSARSSKLVRRSAANPRPLALRTSLAVVARPVSMASASRCRTSASRAPTSAWARCAASGRALKRPARALPVSAMRARPLRTAPIR
jgi:hypothetical protein